MQNTELTGRPYRNHGMFSDHYLNVTLPARPDWKALADGARPAMEEIAGVLDAYLPSENEAQVEDLVEFGVEKPGRKLEDFASLGPDTFVDEVRKRCPKGAGRLTPGALRNLKSGYAEMAGPVRRARSEAAGLERKLSDLVNEAYGLTGEEVDSLWKTAPPRMPGFRYEPG